MGLHPIIMPILCQLMHKWKTPSFTEAPTGLPEDSVADSILHPPRLLSMFIPASSLSKPPPAGERVRVRAFATAFMRSIMEKGNCIWRPCPNVSS